jgi:hypothetical protein
MKYLMFALTLICGSAHATDVFYYVVSDQNTGIPGYIFFTDEKVDRCPENMLRASVVSREKAVINELCWVINRNDWSSFLVLNLSNNQILAWQDYGVVPGSGAQANAFLSKWQSEIRIATRVLNSNGQISHKQAEAEDAVLESERLAKIEAERPREEARRAQESADYRANHEAIKAAEAKKRAASLASCKSLGIVCAY